MRAVPLIAAALLASGHATAANPSAVFGIWWTPERDGVVEFTRCPAGLCGRVAGIVNFDANGLPPRDLHGNSRCHLPLVSEGRLDEDGVWDSAILNPDNDKRYTVRLQVSDDGRLRMRGYVGLPMFGKTVYWTRFDRHLTADCHIHD